MRTHAVAIAFVTKHPERNLGRLVCNVTSVDENYDNEHETLTQYSFEEPLDITNRKQVITLFKKLTYTLGQVIIEQMKTLENADEKYRPVTIVAGKNKKTKPSLNALLHILFPNISYYKPIERLEDLPDDKRKPYAKRWRDKIAEEDPELISTYAAFSAVMDYCYLSWGNYDAIKGAPHERHFLMKGFDEINENIVYYKKRWDKGRTDEDRTDAFYKIIEFAYMHGAGIADNSVATQGNVFAYAAPWKDYATNPELQTRFPKYCYLGWHPDIRDAFNAGFREKMGDLGTSWQIKCPTDPARPYFVDISNGAARKQLDIVLNRISPYEARHNDSIAWRLRLILAAHELSNTKRKPLGYCEEFAHSL